ncbi:MAG: hypothetical protein ACTSRS_00745 [Candidatus Helarchaeota archaeon]
MRIFHQKTVLLLLLLIAFVFIAVGLTIGYYHPLGSYDSVAAYGLPPIE